MSNQSQDPNNEVPDSMTAAQMLSMEEILLELKRRYPSGYLIAAAGRCECGLPDCDGNAFRSSSHGHPATIIGLAKIVEEEALMAFRPDIIVDLDGLGDDDEEGD